MNQDEPIQANELLDYRLGQCDEPGRRAVEAALRSSADARRNLAAIDALLRPLEAYTVEAPANLVGGVLRRVASTQRTLRLPTRRDGLAAAGERGVGKVTLSLQELLSLAAAIVLFVGLLMPAYRTARTTAQRNLCVSQMQTLGGAMAGYAEANADVLPYAGPATPWTVGSNSPLPSAGVNLQVLRTQGFVPSRRFLFCPAQERPADAASGYNSQLFLRPQRIDQLSPSFPVVGDPNPHVHGRVFQPGSQPLNSDSHGRNAGQTVLYIGGNAAWQTRPTVGIANDDIFQIFDYREYAAGQGFSTISDAFLVP